MLEEYLSNQLSDIEAEIKAAKARISENKRLKESSAYKAKELNAQIDPSMEVFSPLRINESIKRSIRAANEEIERSKQEIENDLHLIDELENRRIHLVAMLADFREQGYRLEKYDACDIPNMISRLEAMLARALQESTPQDEIIQLIKGCQVLLHECSEKISGSS